MAEIQVIVCDAPAFAVGFAFTVTLSVCAGEVPHELVAVTNRLPLVALAVVVITLEVDVPAQPPGFVQLYEVAPETRATLYVFDELAQIEFVPLIAVGAEGIVPTVTDFV